MTADSTEPLRASADTIIPRARRDNPPKCFSSFRVRRLEAIEVTVVMACSMAAPLLGLEEVLAQPSPTTQSSSSYSAGHQPSMAGFEEYWTALAEFNVPGLRRAARNELEMQFSDGVALLAAGYQERAESSFLAISRQRGDANIAVASEILLAMTLLGEQKWATLRDVTANSLLSPPDKKNAAELGRWGKAFAGVDRPVTIFPSNSVKLRLSLSPVGTPTIQVRINGSEYQFWLDTGSTITVLSSDVASNAGVALIGSDTLSVGTFAAAAPARPAVVKRLEVGPIALLNSPAIVIDTDLMRVKAAGERIPPKGLQIDGIIGWDIIRQFSISMDYERGTITIQKPESLGTIGTAAQNLTWVGKPIIDARTESGNKIHFALDTGAQGTLLNGSVLNKMAVTSQTSSARVFGIAQTEGQVARRVSALKLDVAGRSLELEDLTVYSPASWSLVEYDGVFGSDISRFGTIKIDATNGLFSVGL